MHNTYLGKAAYVKHSCYHRQDYFLSSLCDTVIYLPRILETAKYSVCPDMEFKSWF